MKIIHCADVHLDSKMLRHLTKEQAKERKNELLNTFEQMVVYANENKVSAIIIAGDLFDTSMISVTTRNFVKDTITNNPGIEFYYLQGNHDIDNFLINLKEIPANLKLFGREWNTYDVAGSDSITITGAEIDNRNHAGIYDSLTLDEGKYNIVVMHGQIQDKGNDNPDIIGLDKIKNKNVDYLALGHYHSYREDAIDPRGTYCYSGCLEGRGFDECGEHGFVLIDIDEKKHTSTRQLVPIASRTVYSIDVDITGCYTTADAKQRITDTLTSLQVDSKSLVKIVLTGEVTLDCECSTDLLEKNFADAYYVFKVVNKTKTKINIEDFTFDETLKGEFARTVLSSKDISEEDKSTIIRYGIQALLGEEI